jgi:hypothetical protein
MKRSFFIFQTGHAVDVRSDGKGRARGNITIVAIAHPEVAVSFKVLNRP